MIAFRAHIQVRACILAAVICVVLAFFPVATCCGDIEVRPSEIDMGTVPVGSTPVCFIEVANRGVETVTVARVEASDSLHIVAELLGEKEIPPGGECRIRVSVYSFDGSTDASVRIIPSSGAICEIPLKWQYARLDTAAGEQALHLAKVDEALSIKALRISPEVLDVGRIRTEARKSCKFLISNTAKADIHLTRAFSSCGCTVVDFKPQKLPVGKTVEIEYYLDASQKYRDFAVPVFIEGTLDGALLRRSATIKGFKEVYYEFLPKKLSFSDSERSQQNSAHEIVVKPLIDRQMSVSSVKSDRGYVSLSVVESPPMTRVLCTARLEELGRGIWEDVVRIEVDISRLGKQTISIPVTIEKEGDLAIMPKRVFYGFVETGREYRKTVTLQSRQGDIENISVLRKPKGLDVSFQITRTSPNAYTIECRLEQMNVSGSNVIKDEICFLVDDKAYCVPVYAIFTEP